MNKEVVFPEDLDFFKKYRNLLELYIELRGKGNVVSSADLDIVLSWYGSRVDPEWVMTLMLDYAKSLESQNKPFPRNLEKMASLVQKYMDSREA
jgi:hypothetical protein